MGASGDLAPLAHMALLLVGEGLAWEGDTHIPGGEALKKAGLTPDPAPAQGGPGPHQRHPAHHLPGQPGGGPAAGADPSVRRDRGPEPGGPARHPLRLRYPHPRGTAPPWSDRGCRAHARDPGHHQRDRRQPPGLHPGPGCLLPALPAPGPRGDPGRPQVRSRDPRAGAEQRHGQSHDLHGAAGEPQRRQLPRPVPGLRLRPARHRGLRSGQHLRAAPGAAGEPRLQRPAGLPDPGRWSGVRLHDGPRHLRRPGLRDEGPGASRLRGHHSHQRRQGGPRQHGPHRRPEAPARRGRPGAGARHRGPHGPGRGPDPRHEARRRADAPLPGPLRRLPPLARPAHVRGDSRRRPQPSRPTSPGSVRPSCPGASCS